MKTTRISLDLLNFQLLCQGQIASATGYSGELEQEVPVEISLQDIGFDNMLNAVNMAVVGREALVELMMNASISEILDRMDQFGGSFVKQLSAMTRRADPVNREKCILTWPKYFIEYSKPR